MQAIIATISAHAVAFDLSVGMSNNRSVQIETMTSAKNIRNGITLAVARIGGATNILKKYP